MAKKEVYEPYNTLSDKLQHLLEIHGNKKTRHFSKFEIELLDLAIKKIRSDEGKSSQDSVQKLKNQEGKHLTDKNGVLLKDKAIIMLESGNTQRLTAKVLGVSEATVAKWKKKHAFELFKKGISAKKIAKTYRVNYSKATKWRRSALGIITKKSTTKASRSTAAKKGAQTKAVNKAKRSAAAKKGAQTKATNKAKRSAAAKKGARAKAANKSKRSTTSKKKTTKKKKRYTQKFQREAMKLIQDGHSGLEVSNILGVNKDTIRQWRKKHGLSGSTNKYSTNLQNDILDLIRDGKSNLEIARITGASSTAVANWRKKFQKEGFQSI